MAVPPKGVEEGDFELIEAAVRETERGRWFLEEFARRVRSSETEALIRAIDRLDGRAAARQEQDDQASYFIQRVIALLIPLVDFLKGEEPELPFPPPVDRIDLSVENDRLRALAALDALSVADKLKLFR